MKGYYSQVAKLLKEYGYQMIPGRGKGSHEVWTNGQRHQVVPRHLDSRDHANNILKQMGVGERFR
jgi:predicted RNA binding protein YcfA (HicA-like mRNA interferase family)